MGLRGLIRSSAIRSAAHSSGPKDDRDQPTASSGQRVHSGADTGTNIDPDNDILSTRRDENGNRSGNEGCSEDVVMKRIVSYFVISQCAR